MCFPAIMYDENLRPVHILSLWAHLFSQYIISQASLFKLINNCMYVFKFK